MARRSWAASVFVAVATVLAATVPAAQAEPIEYYLPENVAYDRAIPKPEDRFGHGVGERPVRHAMMVSYLSELAELSDRISVETIGHSHEGRPILFFIVTSPQNHARLDEIRQAHLDRLTGEGSTTAAGPAIIWINYGVHGAESSAMDAAIPALYHHAAAQGEAIDQTLDASVLLITAVFNPDGNARRIDHVETFGGRTAVTDPMHEQHQLWVEARTNHYWFDLNRQWLLLSQPEPQAWVAKWRRWKPYVTADYHEMGSNASYYFHPGEPKRRNPLIPAEARDLANAIGTHHADWLDSEQRLYYTEQGFDNFYVGKGSTYPQVNGGVGILFETGAARGGRIETPSGERTFADNIRMHFRTTLTTIDGALANAAALETYQRGFFEQALADARADDRRAFVFTTKGDAARRHRFVELLLAHDILVRRLGEPITIADQAYAPDDSFVVPLDQPQYRMARAIFDRATAFEENIFYDVSGWTLPLAYDLDYAAVGDRGFMRNRYGDPSGAFTAGLLGEAVTQAPRVAFEPPPADAYGYIFDWAEYYAPRALHRLLAEDVLVRIAKEPVVLPTHEGEAAFGRGAVFVPLDRQETPRAVIDDIIAAIGREDGVRVHAARTGLSDQVGDEVGGPSFRPVEQPSVLVLFDDGFSRYDAGEVWHLLDYHMAMPVTLRRKSDLAALDWSRYTHLVMVGAAGPLGEDTALPDDVLPRVRQWITEGGTLIALRQSAQWAQSSLWAETSEAPATDGAAGPADAPAADAAPDADSDENDAPLRYDYEDMSLRDAEHVIGGAIFAADLDPSHPLGFGYGDRLLPTHRNTTLVLDWPKANPFAVPVAYAQDDLVLSGYASERRREEIAGSPMVVAERHGAGAVIMMTDNPVFRGTFLGANKLFLNAIFFSSVIDAPRGEYGPMGDR